MSNYMKFVVIASAIMMLVPAWHFGTVFGFWGQPPETQIAFFIRLGIIVAGFIIILIIGAVILAARDEADLDPNEREVHIVRKAERNGGYVVSAGLLVLMWYVFTPMSPMDVANVALGILCIGEVAKIISGLIYLQRGQ